MKGIATLSTNLTGSFVLGFKYVQLLLTELMKLKHARKYEILMLTTEDDESIIFLDLKPLDPCFGFMSLRFVIRTTVIPTEKMLVSYLPLPLSHVQASFWFHSNIQAHFTTTCLSSNDQTALFNFLEPFSTAE